MRNALTAAVGLACLVSAPAGCLDSEDDIIQFEDGFEECELCDWTVTGSARVVTTNHPGEHAAELDSGATVTASLGIPRDGGDDWGYDFTDGNWIEYSTDCHARPVLRLVGAGSNLIDVTLAIGAPASDDFERRKLMFPPLPGDPEGAIVFRQLAVSAAGRCRLDNLRVMVSGGTLGY